jgi:hypothetical protein
MWQNLRLVKGTAERGKFKEECVCFNLLFVASSCLGSQVSPNGYTDGLSDYLYLEEVIMHAGCQVLEGVDFKCALIVSNLQGILGQQLRPHPIPSLNVIIGLFSTD